LACSASTERAFIYPVDVSGAYWKRVPQAPSTTGRLAFAARYIQEIAGFLLLVTVLTSRPVHATIGSMKFNNTADLNYYSYMSKAKLDMLYPQVANRE
jgi:hypothetical protein